MHLDQQAKLTCLSTILSFFLFPFLSGYLPTGSTNFFLGHVPLLCVFEQSFYGQFSTNNVNSTSIGIII